MRTLTGLWPLALVASIVCGGSSPPPVNWPSVVACSGPAQADLVATVRRVLLERNTEPSAELERLAQQHTPDMVACAVDEAAHYLAAVAATPAASQARALSAEQAAAPPAVEQSSAAVAATRGQDFLQRVGTRVEDSDQ